MVNPSVSSDYKWWSFQSYTFLGAYTTVQFLQQAFCAINKNASFFSSYHFYLLGYLQVFLTF
jgi:hypothetical protein